MSNQIIATTPAAAAAYAFALTTDSLTKKQLALEKAEFVLTVSDPAEQQLAINAAADLKAWANKLEKTRKEVKQPFWDAGKKVDEVAAAAVADVLPEIARLEGLITGYQKAEQDKADAIRREQEAIAAQIERDRLAGIARAEKEAADKLAAEQAAQRAAQEATSKKAREAAQAGADRLAKEREEKEMQNLGAPESAPVVLPPAPQAPKAQGAAVKRELDFEVTDILALFRYAGTRFCKIEVDRVMLKGFINQPGAPAEIPGITIKDVTKVSVRATR